MDSHNKDWRDVRKSGQYKGLPARDTRAARVPLYWLRARLSSLYVVSVQSHAPPTTKAFERGGIRLKGFKPLVGATVLVLCRHGAWNAQGLGDVQGGVLRRPAVCQRAVAKRTPEQTRSRPLPRSPRMIAAALDALLKRLRLRFGIGFF